VVLVRQEADEYVARFVTHITLTDAAPIVPGSTLVKTWRMMNDGVRAWPVGTRLVHVGAETLGCPVEGVEVPPVAPGACADISLTLIAPELPGRHVGYFRLVTPGGVRFGHRIWADLFVENSNAAAVFPSGKTPLTPVPAPAPAAPAVSLPAVPVSVPTPPPTAPPAPEPVAPAPAPAEPKWHAALLQMADMGFFDVDVNTAALEAHDGNVSRAVEAVLASM